MRILYSKKKVIFPFCNITMIVKQRRYAGQLKPGDKIIIYPVKNVCDYIRIRGLAVLAEVVKSELSNNNYAVAFKGIKRVRIDKRRTMQECEFTEIDDKDTAGKEVSEQLRKKSKELIFLINVDESDKLIHLLNFIPDAGQLSDFIANYFILNYNERVKLLNTTDSGERIHEILKLLNVLIDSINQKRENTAHEKENIHG